jgi:putative FmdB family regulatory protein
MVTGTNPSSYEARAGRAYDSFGMPIYEFDCRKCGARFEELVRAGGTAACPKCGSEDVERRFSPISEPRVPVGLHGKAAAESNARRKDREARRQEGFREDRKRRERS